MLDDEPTGRDLRVIWRTIAVVGAALVTALALAAGIIAWAIGQAETNVAQNQRMAQFERDVDALSKRIDGLDRDWKWHQRGHAPSTR